MLGKRLNSGELDSFPSLYDFMAKSEEDFDADMLRNTKDLLKGLKRGLFTRFPESDLSVDKKPFPLDIQTLPLASASEEEQRLELASDGFARKSFQRERQPHRIKQFSICCHSRHQECVNWDSWRWLALKQTKNEINM
jgi:hypothetical protein